MDLSLPGEWERRTWRWFKARLFGLSVDSRTWRRLLADRQQVAEEEAGLDELDAMLGIDRE